MLSTFTFATSLISSAYPYNDLDQARSIKTLLSHSDSEEIKIIKVTFVVELEEEVI